MEISKCQRCVLVVEDDNDIRESIVEMLKFEGYEVDSASNGKEALDKINEFSKPCLVLLDMMMPIMNGREFLDHVMKSADLAPIPIIVVSAVADKVNTLGARGYIKKPVDIDAVLKVVSQHCRAA